MDLRKTHLRNLLSNTILKYKKRISWYINENSQNDCKMVARFCCVRHIFFSDFPKAVKQHWGIWRHMINLVYGVCRSPSLQPFRKELGHSKYIYRKGVSLEGGDDWLASHGEILLDPRDTSLGSLCLFQTNRGAGAS